MCESGKRCDRPNRFRILSNRYEAEIGACPWHLIKGIESMRYVDPDKYTRRPLNRYSTSGVVIYDTK